MYRLILAFSILSKITADSSDIKNLIGEPDYREVRLHWETDKDEYPKNFQIRYCELQSWGRQRCRSQEVSNSVENFIEYDDNVRSYNTRVGGLKMATTYSFEIRTEKKESGREDRSQGKGKNRNVIVIPTKGFSAKATQCLSHASEIEVSTGPYFGGRITVEAADGERCALDGDPTNPRDTYTLRINHDECGSRVNATTVVTYVIVQENLPILTHSTRRFLVICSYQPETLTVRAGLNLPTHHKGQAQLSPVNFETNYESTKKSRYERIGRVYEGPEALVKDEDAIKDDIYSDNIVSYSVMSVLSITIIIAIVITIKKTSFNNKRKQFDENSISGVSGCTISSCSTIPEYFPERNDINNMIVV